MPDIFRLCDDINNLFVQRKDKVDEANLSLFLGNIKTLLTGYLEKSKEEKRDNGNLRLSRIGLAPRKLWMDKNYPSSKAVVEDGEIGGNSGSNLFRFLYGHIIEELVRFLARESGHVVENVQEEVEVGGVKGHLDCTIDKRLVDVKSVSPFTFDKFSKGEILTDRESDAFGYLGQMSAYHKGKNLPVDEPPLFVAVNKSSGQLALLETPLSFLPCPEELVRTAKEVTKEGAACPPSPCFAPKAEGKSGNEKIANPCGWCEHKFRCFPHLRAFSYSNGVKFLSKVIKTPEVPEVTERYRQV